VNLMAVACPAIQVINPNIDVQLIRQNSYTTVGDGTRTPDFEVFDVQTSQVQQLTASELRQTEGLNLSTQARGIYLYGSSFGVTRIGQNGGDIIVMPDDSQWLVTSVLEQWVDWCKVSIVNQSKLITIP